jgi:hypothetical protein
MSITNRTIYAQLGNLFYSIAASEGLKSLNTNRLKLLISKDWVPRSWNDELLISDEAHFMLTGIDALYENRISAHEAYAEFSKFYAMHPELFSLETKHQINATSEEIAELFTEDDVSSNPYLKSSRKLLYANKMPVY